MESATGWTTNYTKGGFGEDYPQLGFTEWMGGWRHYKDWLISEGQEEFATMAGNHDVIQSAPEGQHMFSLLGEEYHMATYFTNEATGFIRAKHKDDKPWGAVVSYFGPHLPVAPPKPWDTLYALSDVELPSNLVDSLVNKPKAQRKTELQYVLGQWTHKQYKDYIRRYWGYSGFIDAQIGRIFTLLKETNQWENTIIIFTSDHGDMVGGHGMIFKLGSNAYEELFHVPAIIRIPGSGKVNGEVKSLTSSIDIFPTVLDAARIEIPAGVDGQSLLPLLSGEVDEGNQPVFAEIHSPGPYGKIIMCRDGRYKYVYHWQSPDMDELYDLERDAGELDNLYTDSKSQDVVMRMQKSIIDWSRSTGHTYANLIANKSTARK